MPWRRGKLNRQKNFIRLQEKLGKINKNDYIIIPGDYNARVGRIPID
jgi:hypothetical protein